jgi:hypothetical protein
MATTKAQLLEAELTRVQAKIQSGISSTATDGTSVSLDLAALEREANRLRGEISLEARKRPKTGTLRIW